MKGRFVIEAKAKGVRIDVKLNDVLLFTWPGTFPNTINWFVNQWVVTGENRLEVEINEAPRGFDPKASVRVELNYYKYDPRAIIGKTEHDTIASIDWVPPVPETDDSEQEEPSPLSPEVLDAPPPSYDFPETLLGVGTIVDSQPEWLWTKGEVIVPTPDVILSAVEKLNDLTATIRAKDSAKFDGILRTIFAETDTAYGLAPGKTSSTMIVKKAWREKKWDVKDIVTDTLESHLYADGRLLELTPPDGGPILQAIEGLEKYQFKMRLMFAEVDGALVIAR